jgi:hypothetical protein
MDLASIEELSLPNYAAVSILERLGIKDPSLDQVDIMESVVLMASYPHKVKPGTIEQCVGDDKLAALFLYLKNKDLRS